MINAIQFDVEMMWGYGGIKVVTQPIVYTISNKGSKRRTHWGTRNLYTKSHSLYLIKFSSQYVQGYKNV